MYSISPRTPTSIRASKHTYLFFQLINDRLRLLHRNKKEPIRQTTNSDIRIVLLTSPDIKVSSTITINKMHSIANTIVHASLITGFSSLTHSEPIPERLAPAFLSAPGDDWPHPISSLGPSPHAGAQTYPGLTDPAAWKKDL